MGVPGDNSSRKLPAMSRNRYGGHMSKTRTSATAEEIQSARAAYIKNHLDAERWSLRLLEGRTGVPKSTLSSRLSGATPLTFGDIELFAEVLNRDPVEFFRELRELPDQDSNLEPTHFKLARESMEVIDLAAAREQKTAAHSAVHSDHDATVYPIFGHAAAGQ